MADDIPPSSFVLEEILSQDTRTKTLVLLGTAGPDRARAILIAEKTAFAINGLAPGTAFAADALADLRLLDHNDVYRWFMATAKQDVDAAPAVKLSLICPASDTHVRKYSRQRRRMIVETPELYRTVVAPYVERMRGDRITWVYNILSHKVEVDRIVHENPDPDTGFILLPDLKWDRTTMEALYLVAIVHTHSITSMRDLNKSHLPFLRSMRAEIVGAVETKYGVSRDLLRMYVHYQPSYYHFHIHVTHIDHDMLESVAAGRAVLYDSIVAQLESMSDEHYGFANSTLSYYVGENSELWASGFSAVADHF
ncbi:HIT-like domain-containing protein [Dipodascopsis tothii]|uniref:HIT-like domain-containing protein n=1 Tax=Dipodascopsis tothii TaxID=44089 RepID=UPI0034CFAF3B